MTETNLPFSGDPTPLSAVKPARKRKTAAGTTSESGTNVKGVRGAQPEPADKPTPKRRSAPLKGQEKPTESPLSVAPPVLKKRSPRKATPKDAGSSDGPTHTVQEPQPFQLEQDPEPRPAAGATRRKKGTSPDAVQAAPEGTTDEVAPRPRKNRRGAEVAPVSPSSKGEQAKPAEATRSDEDSDHSFPPGGTSEPSSGTFSASADPADRPRRAYPVYVPLHIAKQMQQEGRPAPLAVDPGAQQAEEIRAAALENRHGASHAQPLTHADSGTDAADQAERHEPNRGDRHSQPQQNRQERGQPAHPNQRHDRDSRNPQRGPGQERNRGGRHNERHRNREDHRRNERREHSHEGGHHDSHREQHQELPPPTPEELFPGGGVIEISGKGFGFLRDPLRNFAQHPADIFVSPEMVRRFNLRDGQMIQGSVRKSGRGQQMHEITSVNDDPPEASKNQPAFDELTVINPCEPLQMATVAERYTTRIIDMLTPIGKGQRGLIVAQPRTGKTTFLQHIADAMVKNHPDVKLIILLVDERPEEVTEIRHTVPSAEIMASSNDMDVRSHTRIAELAIERAKRLVEAGKDVFILLDSITRLGRAFNNALSNGGRTMSGGLDARALETPRKLFAAARNTEEAGSLTIIATALIDTGSRMDEIIFQEFKGTGNMELVLDRKIAESRIYPAVDIFQSGTRREELLVPADLLQKIHFLRRGLSGARPMDAIDRLLSYLKKFHTNEQMLREIRG
jgi:transcription termination factor Rho